MKKVFNDVMIKTQQDETQHCITTAMTEKSCFTKIIHDESVKINHMSRE